jgi:hypothetical protein
MHTWINLS